MRKIVCLCMMLLYQLVIFGQSSYGVGDGYDPTSPGDPQTPVSSYTLQTISSPSYGGSTSISNITAFKAGQNINIYAYQNSNYRFVKWMIGDSIVSTESSFSYTMPARNVVLTAVFVFDPTSPASPDSTARSYQLTVNANPSYGGSFNVNNTSLKENYSIDIYAYPNTNYVFKGWKIDGKVVSLSSPYTHLMGKSNFSIEGLFEFVPGNPQNPGKNFWNASTGAVIIDDFSPGNLLSAIDNAIGGSDKRGNITMITVAGCMNYYDFSVANYCSNCALLDLSRTYGYNEIPAYAFDGNNLTSVILPSSVVKINYRAFYNCSRLTDVTCYAVSPPLLESEAFTGIADGAVLHVLSSSIPLYSEAEGWKDFTSLPLLEEVRTIEVDLPAESADGRYKNMTLELVNTGSGQVYKYVVSDRITYTFNGLIKGTEYNIYLKNQLQKVLGEIDKVVVDNDNVKVTFDKIIVPQSITLKVNTPNGTDVTSLTQITWTDAKGTYLSMGPTISGITPSTVLNYSVSIGQSLGLQYVIPQVHQYTVAESDNNPLLTLAAIDTLNVTGVVKDVNGGVISGATVAISQKLNGKYYKTFTIQTNSRGVFNANVYKQPSSVTVSATDYISKTLSYDSLSNRNLGSISLKSITGATITTNFTYTGSVLKDSTAKTQNWYSDYANVTYSIYNETKSKAITGFNVQYPSIVLLEEVGMNDQLSIIATSKNNGFKSVTVKTKIDSLNHAVVTIPILQYGGIRASFKQTGNSSVIGLLYGSDGVLIKKYTYNIATLNITDLSDGRYTLVTMAGSLLFNGIMRLDQFVTSGLTEGTDYVVNVIDVKSGIIAAFTNERIPTLDESKLYYTGSNTSFTVNKSSVISGNYLTLKGVIDFKDVYKNSVSGVSMIVDLPVGTSFVENSVMVGSKVSSYNYDGSRLTIPVSTTGDQVRFCIIPTMGGSYVPNAYAHFTLNGKSVQQPIGTAPYTVKDLSITVPSTVARTTVSITGAASANSQIEIFDNDVLIGTTTSLATGTWVANCELNNAYNLSTHQIYAKVTTKSGLKLQSETEELRYDMNAIEVSKVTMLNTAHGSSSLGLLEYRTVFDFKNPKTKLPAYWYWPSYPDFTFLIDFTSNDTTKVSNVKLNVFTEKNNFRTFNASFNKNQWVVSSRFDDNDLPINVSVEFTSNNEKVYDSRQLTDVLSSIESLADSYSKSITKIDSLFNLNQDISDSELALLREQLGLDAYQNTFNDSLYNAISKMTEAEYTQYMDRGLARQKVYNDSVASFINTINALLQLKKECSFTLNSGVSFEMTTCQGLSPEALLNEGYSRYKYSDSSSVYMLTTENKYIYVDFNRNIKIAITTNSSQSPLKSNTEGQKSFADQCKDGLEKIQKVIDRINFWANDLISKAAESEKNLEQAISIIKGNIGEADVNIKLAEVKGDNVGLFKWKAQKFFSERNLFVAEKALKTAKSVFKHVFKLLPVANYISTAIELSGKINTLQNIYFKIPEPCVNDQENATLCKARCYALLASSVSIATADLLGSFISDAEVVAGIVGSVATAGTSLMATVWGIAQKAVLTVGRFCLDNTLTYAINRLNNDVDNLNCSSGHDDDYIPPPPPCGSTSVVRDPSGFVYEAVSSNRVEGVTATVYYKETVEDMYGDKHENTVLWNAAEYAQENPLFTDENGMYAWDVPQGLWQVKFEKDGYQTAYSEWLPVPPPQLDVNIPITQNTQPGVTVARAYEDGIDVEFDKYMLPESLNTDNIYVTKNGKKVYGKVKFLNAENANGSGTSIYASKIRFVPDTTFLTTDEITLIVYKKVKSYAGIQMQNDYSQNFDIVKEIKSIVADSTIKVLYNGSKEITVSVLPYDAGIGKKLIARSASTSISTVTSQALLDGNGQAKLTVTGELPGVSVIIYSIEDADVKSTSIVNVVNSLENQMTALPVSSRVSGTEVYKNSTVVLTCSDKGAKIFYTTDGTCPCDVTGTRNVYISPIVIGSDMTIKSMAVAGTKAESEVATYSYKIKNYSGTMALKTGWNWISYNLQPDLKPTEFVNAHVLRLVGQNSELVLDPRLGLTGNLNATDVKSLYKVQMNADSTYVMSGCEYDPNNAVINLKSGWNWIGYPVGQTLSLSEALKNLNAEESDFIIGQDGLAEYSSGVWTGTLTTLNTGKGYMYKSVSEKSFIYYSDIVSKAKSLYGKSLLDSSPWAVDKYSYPNIMGLIADVYTGGAKAESSDYTVGAFCGSECRGIGQYVKGTLMMNIYGHGDEKINFMAFNNSTEQVYDITETTSFSQSVMGDLNSPYLLHIGNQSTGITSASNSLNAYISKDGRLYIEGLSNIEKVSLTDMGGSKVYTSTWQGNHLFESVNGLPDAAYILTVVSDGKTYYKKLIKRGN